MKNPIPSLLLLLSATPSLAAQGGPGDLYVGGDGGIIYRGNAAEGDFEPWLFLGPPIRQMVQEGDDLFAAVVGGLVMKVDIPAVTATYAYSAAADVTALGLSDTQVFAGSAAGDVDRYDRVDGTFEGTLSFGLPIVGLAEESGELLVATEGGLVFKVDLATDQITPWTQLGRDLNGMEVGLVYAYSPTVDGHLARFNGLVQEPATMMDLGVSALGALETFDGRELLVASQGGELVRVDAETGSQLTSLGRLPFGARAMVLDASSIESPGASFCAPAAGACPCGNEAASACANSTGGAAELLAVGSTSLTADNLYLSVRGIPAHQPSAFFMGGGQIVLPFGDGLRCAGAGSSGLFRFPIESSGPGGFHDLDLGIVAFTQTQFGGAGAIKAGSTWNFQSWFRDPAGPCGSGLNLSNAIELSFLP